MAAALFLSASVIGAMAAVPADAQTVRMDTMADNFVGLGNETPAARLIFQRQEGQLCVLVAIPPSPTELRAQLFRFSKLVEGKRRLEPLRFKLPKTPTQPPGHKDRVRIWEACSPNEPAGAGKATLRIQYRDPRMLRETAETNVGYPEPALPTGVDVLKDSAGTLVFRGYDATQDQGP